MTRKIAALLALLSLCACVSHAAPSATSPVASATQVGRYEKFEATFGVTTSATVLYWPYDPSPAANTAEHPNAVAAGVGVSVDGLFLPPGETSWDNAVVQPAFYTQPLSTVTDPSTGLLRVISNQRAWFYPSGSPTWMVRFAPTATGTWRYKLRVRDSSGEFVGSEFSFDCVDSTGRGFVRVSSTDSRYFETSDGSYLSLIGLHGPSTAASMESTLASYEEMGVNFIRSWWQNSSGIVPLFGASGQGGDAYWGHLTYSTDYVPQGKLIAAKVPDNTAGPSAGLNVSVAVKPSTTYRLTANLKAVGVTGSGDYGLWVARDWPTGTTKLKGDVNWTDVTLDFTTSAGVYETCLSAGLYNVTGGSGYCSKISLRELLSGGQLGPELVGRPDFEPYKAFNQPAAAAGDLMMDLLRQHNIYLKMVVEEKQDIFYGSIQADGSWGSRLDENVYADSTHASRTFQQYYWRYLIARYGYSPNVHSFEFANECDPAWEPFYDAPVALSNYVRANDPNQHLVTNSNWHSFPPHLWQKPEMDYADLHMYLGNNSLVAQRIWPGWDGKWTGSYANTLQPGFEIDEAVKHSGRRSLKMTIPSSATPQEHSAGIEFETGLLAGHQIRVSVWVKGSNIKSHANVFRPNVQLCFRDNHSGDYSGVPTSPTHLYAPDTDSEYDWQLISFTFTVPETTSNGTTPHILCVYPRHFGNNDANPGYAWFDDMTVDDLTTGLCLNYNGGFEYVVPEAYDIVAGHVSHSRRTRSFQLGKPTVKGELGLVYPQRYGDTYKGFGYTGEDQALVDDVDGLCWKKLTWSQMDSGGMIEIWWWVETILPRKFIYAKAYQTFMSDIMLSNGKYQDVSATVSNPDLRVLGQKDLTNNCAHFWIDNAPYTWKAVVDHNYQPESWSSTATYALDSTCGSGSPVHVYKSLQNNNKNHAVTDAAWWQDMGEFNASGNPPIPPSISGAVTVSGFADGNYRVEWWDTATGQIALTESIVCTGGNIVLSVQNIQSDIACKIKPVAPRVLLTISVPTDRVTPGQIITVTVGFSNTGDATATNVSVRATVPEQMEYLAGSAEASGGVYNSLDQSISWTIPSLAAGASGTRTFQATVK